MGEIKILESLNYIDDIFISDAIFHKTVRRSDKLLKNKIVKITVLRKTFGRGMIWVRK